MEIYEAHPHGGSWLREVVFGLGDGLVTTLVFVLAVSGVFPEQIVLITLGEMLAGAISMGLGGYLSARTEQAIISHRIETERYEIANEPIEERAELRQIYREKGLSGELLDQVVHYLTEDRERWLNAMVRDELGIQRYEKEISPGLQGTLVGLAFLIGAFVPVIPFVFALSEPRLWAYGLTVVTAFLLGALKARYTIEGPLRNGLEFLAIVSLGALGGLAIGAVLHQVFG